MGITVINSLGIGTAAAGAANVQQQTTQPPPDTEDTVQLSEAQQVYQLYNQGQPVSQIASTLSLTVAAVNSYLNVSQTGG